MVHAKARACGMDKAGVRMGMEKGLQPSIPSSDAGSQGASRRKRRKHHERSKNLPGRPKRRMEITLVTLLALAILFGALYFLLSREQRTGEESMRIPTRHRVSETGSVARSVALFPHQVERAGAHVAVLAVEPPA
jgi:hypothetical protein